MTASHRPRIGMTFTSDMDPRELTQIAVDTEARGLDELWVFEDCFSASAIPIVTAALAATTTLKVGIALSPAPLRNVALLAMDIATIERMHPGRLMPGIGTGVLSWMEQIGEKVPSPMTRLRESANALSRLLAGENVTVNGEYVTLTNVQLQFPPQPPPPIYIGANGPKMLTLAGTRGHGTLLSTGLPEEAIIEKAHLTRSAAAASGKTAHEIVLLHLVATGENAQSRLESGLARWGTPGAQAGAAGDATEIAQNVKRLHQAGVSAVSFMPTPDVTDLSEFIRFLGEDVAPQL